MPIVSADHLVKGGDSGGFEPQRQNHFTFEIVLNDKQQQELVSLAVDSAFEPQEENEAGELHFWNEKRFFAGKFNWANSPSPLNLKDFVDQPVRDAILEWRRLVHDPETGRGGLARDYKKEAKVKLYAPDGSLERSWTLKGVWPQAVSWNSDGLDYSAGEYVKIEVTLQYDTASWDRALGGSVSLGSGAPTADNAIT